VSAASSKLALKVRAAQFLKGWIPKVLGIASRGFAPAATNYQLHARVSARRPQIACHPLPLTSAERWLELPEELVRAVGTTERLIVPTATSPAPPPCSTASCTTPRSSHHR
jgi:hypothetical protein